MGGPRTCLKVSSRSLGLSVLVVLQIHSLNGIFCHSHQDSLLYIQFCYAHSFSIFQLYINYHEVGPPVIIYFFLPFSPSLSFSLLSLFLPPRIDAPPVLCGNFYLLHMRAGADPSQKALCRRADHCSLFGFSSQPIIFSSHIAPAPASSHQPANSIFLSHHSSTSHQHQYSEQSGCALDSVQYQYSNKKCATSQTNYSN